MGIRRPDTPAPRRSRRHTVTRGTAAQPAWYRAIVLATEAAVVILIAVACSREGRHQVLVFLYDGVPPLDDGVVGQEAGPAEDAATLATGEKPPGPKPEKEMYSHPLYWENRCGSCHTAGGTLLRTVRQGLCASCHFQKPAEKKKYLHGPVAVNDCLACHRYHRSRHEKILLTDAQTLCSYCHVTEELTPDKHHETMDKEPCVKCHDPHGGDERFYLLPGVAPANSSQDVLIIERKQ